MPDLSFTIPGWLVLAVVGSVAWFFVYRLVVRALERRYWNTGATMLSERTRRIVAFFAGPVVWIALALDVIEQPRRRPDPPSSSEGGEARG